ncbi:MAG: preprotein translocase subunit SecE [Lachnospiraceae bacterium]|nr:preprotein translocase subunit SecE [Lachnospiraceae bacterium]
MGEASKQEKESRVAGFVKGLKTEYRKIVWPKQDDVVKQTIAVLVTTVALALVIALLDLVFKAGLDRIFSLL